MTRVFVSGCFDVLHGGHMEFLEAARKCGSFLYVCLPTDDVVAQLKGRCAIPLEHKIAIFRRLRMVDEILIGGASPPHLNFLDAMSQSNPDILVTTQDDSHALTKKRICEELGVEFIMVDKSKSWPAMSTTEIVKTLRAPASTFLRIDFAGGWLDVPDKAIEGGVVVNCTFTPGVTLNAWPYMKQAGLGGSAAIALLRGEDSVEKELNNGVGWQDPAVLLETGLCVWKSGNRPILEFKVNPKPMLTGRMAVFCTDVPHDTFNISTFARNYGSILEAGLNARRGVLNQDIGQLASATNQSYQAQIDEGMTELPTIGELAKKYCGGGWGGYALYIFECKAKRDSVCLDSRWLPIEPSMRFDDEHSR